MQPREPTEPEVTFVEGPDGTTRVDLEHRGWERLGARGSEVRSSYELGWPPVLERFAAAASA